MRKTFYTIRYTLVPQENIFSYHKFNDEGRLELFKECFLIDKEYEYREKEDKENKIILTVANIACHKDIYSGKFGKKKITKLPEKNSTGQIEQVNHTTWPHLDFFCNLQKQILLVQSSTTDLNLSPQAICRYFHFIANKNLNKIDEAKYSYEICFESIIEEGSFWKTIDNSDKIYSIEIKLNSPNMLGMGDDAANALKELKNEFNQSEYKLLLKNKKGELNIKKNKELKSYIEYAEKGGGEWKVVSSTNGNNKNKVNSFDNTSKKIVEFDNVITTDSIVKAINSINWEYLFEENNSEAN